jgi:Putative esterase
LGAQRGTKPPAPAQIGTPVVRLRDERVDSAAIGRTMAYCVLLPEHYANGLRRFPVLYLLDGLLGHAGAIVAGYRDEEVG